jgi:hypothetical protein
MVFPYHHSLNPLNLNLTQGKRDAGACGWGFHFVYSSNSLDISFNPPLLDAPRNLGAQLSLLEQMNKRPGSSDSEERTMKKPRSEQDNSNNNNNSSCNNNSNNLFSANNANGRNAILDLISSQTQAPPQSGSDHGEAPQRNNLVEQVKRLLLEREAEERFRQAVLGRQAFQDALRVSDFIIGSGQSTLRMGDLSGLNSLPSAPANPNTNMLVYGYSQNGGHQSVAQQQNPFYMPNVSGTGAGAGTANVNAGDLSTLITQLHASSQAAARQQQQQQTFQSLSSLQDHSVAVSASPAVSVTHAEMPALPPCDDEGVAHYSTRPMFPLGTDEDPNWLSGFHCFVRSELIEVFRASPEDRKARNQAVVLHQVGIRCRFCAHVTPSIRAGRSTAFPSSIRQIYQSFTMMLRDHFGNCEAMPRAIQEKFLALKEKPSQGATDSKRYWIYSAMKIGMADSRKGIIVDETTRARGANTPPFGTSPEQQTADEETKDVPLVLPEDRAIVSDFLFLLMSHSQLVFLTEVERVGNRRSLRLGLPGFGCRCCSQHKRLGLCRMFPARRRTLPTKVSDLYDHLRRCTVCPAQVKDRLESLHHQMNTGFHSDQGGDREFFDRLWNRLGHTKST